MTKNYMYLLASFLLASLIAAPACEAKAQDNAGESLYDKEQQHQSSSSILVMDDKGVVRPADVSGIKDTGRSDSVAQKQGNDKMPHTNSSPAPGNGISKENPLYVTADRMRYSDITGDVDAAGKVEIKHMMDTYQTEYVYGNTIAQKYVIPGEVSWINPATKLKADRAEYDASKGLGRFQSVNGWQEGIYFFKGARGTYDRNANKMVIEKGYFTTKHAVAKVPDYRIEADSIEIYPKDHYTAHNVKLLAKNTVLLTLSSYTGSLVRDESEVSLWSLIPRPAFDSDNGIGLHNEVALPIGGNLNLTGYIKNRWYAKSGYKPDFGIRYRTPMGTASLHYTEEESTTNDDGGIWVKKRPSLEFDTNHFYLFHSRIYVGANGELGYWEEDGTKGAYKGFDAYISGDPWKLGKFMNFGWRAGVAKDYYSANDTIRRNSYYSLSLSGGYRSVSAWAGYTNRDLKGDTPYRYDSYSSDKPLDTGFRWQITPIDAVSLAWSIDTANGRLNHRYWTYYRDMHSFYAWIRYDDIEKETKFMIMPKDFKF